MALRQGDQNNFVMNSLGVRGRVRNDVINFDEKCWIDKKF